LPDFNEVAAGGVPLQMLIKERDDIAPNHFRAPIEPHSLGIDSNIAIEKERVHHLYTIE
jgi:hypothetical protein